MISTIMIIKYVVSSIFFKYKKFKLKYIKI